MTKQNTILITGGYGFIGGSVAKRLIERNPQKRIVLIDIIDKPHIPEIKDKVAFIKANLSTPGICRELITGDVDTIFHFAALVSAGAEQDFEAGLRANVYAPLNLFEACRQLGTCPRIIYSSTVATFWGKDVPDEINDYTHQHPQNSYGVAKVIMEQMLNDYSRKGYIDGRGIRLPAVIVRNEPNSAATTYASSIIREPIAGNDYACPVTPETRIKVLSIARCVDAMIKLRELEPGSLDDYRCINAPSLFTSAGELAEAVRNCGADGLGTITFEPDCELMAITKSAKPMRSDRAKALGFEPDESVDAIVADYLKQKRSSQ